MPLATWNAEVPSMKYAHLHRSWMRQTPGCMRQEAQFKATDRAVAAANEDACSTDRLNTQAAPGSADEAV